MAAPEPRPYYEEVGHILVGDLTTHQHARRLLDERWGTSSSKTRNRRYRMRRCRWRVENREGDTVLELATVLDGDRDDRHSEIDQGLVHLPSCNREERALEVLDDSAECRSVVYFWRGSMDALWVFRRRRARDCENPEKASVGIVRLDVLQTKTLDERSKHR